MWENYREQTGDRMEASICSLSMHMYCVNSIQSAGDLTATNKQAQSRSRQLNEKEGG